jgi:hypothetical protein
MITKEFQTENEAVEYLIQDKEEKCEVDLIQRFYAARKEGLDLHNAAEKAQLLHSHITHQHGQDVPDNLQTPEAVEELLTSSLLTANDDGKAQERIDLTLSIHRRFMSWGANAYYAAACALAVAEYEWYAIKANDLDENEWRTVYEQIKIERVRQVAIATFNEVLKDNGIVYFAVKAAKEAIAEATALEMVLSNILTQKSAKLN